MDEGATPNDVDEKVKQAVADLLCMYPAGDPTVANSLERMLHATADGADFLGHLNMHNIPTREEIEQARNFAQVQGYDGQSMQLIPRIYVFCGKIYSMLGFSVWARKPNTHGNCVERLSQFSIDGAAKQKALPPYVSP